MECICEKIADGMIELSPTCLGHLWLFGDLVIWGFKRR